MQKIIAPERLETSVQKFRSPLRYPGGKQKAISRIGPLIPSGFLEYREPMVGGGSVYFFARSENLFEKYWINDKFSELISFWKTVQEPGACSVLMNKLFHLKNQFNSPKKLKEYFLRMKDVDTTDSMETALLFFFFNRVTFSGTTKAGGFSVEASKKRFTDSSIQRLEPMPEALDGTKITLGNYADVIKADGERVFLFIDPPYVSANKLYGKNGELHNFQHAELADLLKNTKHKFLMTYDDHEDVRKLYRRWANVQQKLTVKEWSLRYGMNNCNTQKACKVGCELFISNY
jgi:DNA adenine methylase